MSMKPTSPEDLSDLLDKMTPEQLAALKEQILKKEAEETETEEKEDSRENTDENE